MSFLLDHIIIDNILCTALCVYVCVFALKVFIFYGNCKENLGELYIGRGPHGLDNHRRPKIRPEGACRRRNFWEKLRFLPLF